ncbi:Rrf2 family transcriptional regulator [Coralliovum pocilloporae]|uniref:Rrf2 family transcriptional regulator n=1 Tax=Coralliovum pocilloporae TaxID=3066369 RepID=UPI003306EB3B
MRLTKQTSYALRILMHCAMKGDEYAKIAEIAKTYAITEYNVFKIVPLLVQAGFLDTARGRNGGIKLAMPAPSIRIGDVVRATEETYIQADCFGSGVEECAIQQASPLNRMLDRALDAFVTVLDEHTLEDIMPHRARAGQAPAEVVAALDA